MRRVELGASQECGAIITELNGWDLDPSQLTTDRDEAARRKHRYYYEDVALYHCDSHEHTWTMYNDGPVRECTECFAFDLTDYDPSDPGPPTVEPTGEIEPLTPDVQEARRIHRQLSDFWPR